MRPLILRGERPVLGAKMPGQPPPTLESGCSTPRPRAWRGITEQRPPDRLRQHCSGTDALPSGLRWLPSSGHSAPGPGGTWRSALSPAKGSLSVPFPDSLGHLFFSVALATAETGSPGVRACFLCPALDGGQREARGQRLLPHPQGDSGTQQDLQGQPECVPACVCEPRTHTWPVSLLPAHMALSTVL